jgi:hypothetical protein
MLILVRRTIDRHGRFYCPSTDEPVRIDATVVSRPALVALNGRAGSVETEST